MIIRSKVKVYLFLLVLAFSSPVISPANADDFLVRVGVLKIWGEKRARQMWQPTINYLNQKITHHKFQLIPLNLSEIANATAQKKIDFILTNSGNYVSLEANYDVARILTLRTRRQDHITTYFSAVIFTRAIRHDLQKLEDLKQKSFMGVKETAFGGYQMAWYELKQHGINPYTDFSSLLFSGFPQDKVVYSVLDGKVDAGTVRSGTLERMATEGLINMDEIKVLNSHNRDSFPFKHSTKHYPEWPLSKLPHVSESLAKKVAIALLSLEENSKEALATNSGGWTVPHDYTSVHELMKDLQVGPYTPSINSTETPPAYYFIILVLILLALVALVIYNIRLRHRVHDDIHQFEQTNIE